jgi:hypothetical protein
MTQYTARAVVSSTAYTLALKKLGRQTIDIRYAAQTEALVQEPCTGRENHFEGTRIHICCYQL